MSFETIVRVPTIRTDSSQGLPVAVFLACLYSAQRCFRAALMRRRASSIALALKLSIKTAVYHKTAIMDKLGLRTTAALTRYALEHGVLPRASVRELVRPLPILNVPVDQESCDTLARSVG